MKMDNVKIEISYDRICRGCLSLDRSVAPLGVLSDLFYTISKPQGCMYDNVLLCWECKSVLKKTWRFQQRIQQAQFFFQQPEFYQQQLGNSKTYSLSTLRTVAIDNNYETILYDYKDNEQKVKLEIEQDVEKINSDLDDNIHEDVYGGEEIKIEIKEEVLDDKETKEEEKKKESLNENEINIQIKKGQSKYKKYARVTKNNLNNIEKLYIKNYLNDKVLEEILDRRIMIKCKKIECKNICKICQMAFLKKMDLKRHMIVKHLPANGPYKCSECRNTGKLTTMTELRAHWQSHAVYKCQLCPEVCRFRSDVKKHLLHVHRHNYQCLKCEKSFNAFREFFLHYKNLHDRVICDHCGRTFIKKKTLETHIKRQHLPPVCCICGDLFKNVNVLESHTRRVHPELHYDVSNKELSFCVECNKQFSSVYKYRRHLSTALIHRPPKPVRVPCPECGKVFAKKIYMTNHYNLFHTKKSKHYCEICAKYFANAFGLRTHRQRIHEKKLPPKNKICDICGRGFSANRILINHRRTHTGEKPYQCSQCPSAFAQLWAKKSHERSQHKL